MGGKAWPTLDEERPQPVSDNAFRRNFGSGNTGNLSQMSEE